MVEQGTHKPLVVSSNLTLAMYLFKNGNNPNPTKRLITNFGTPHVSEVWRCSNKAASSRHCEEYTLAMYLFKNGNNPNPTKRLITNFGTPHVSEVWRCSNKAASSRHCEEYTLAICLFLNPKKIIKSTGCISLASERFTHVKRRDT